MFPTQLVVLFACQGQVLVQTPYSKTYTSLVTVWLLFQIVLGSKGSVTVPHLQRCISCLPHWSSFFPLRTIRRFSFCCCGFFFGLSLVFFFLNEKPLCVESLFRSACKNTQQRSLMNPRISVPSSPRGKVPELNHLFLHLVNGNLERAVFFFFDQARSFPNSPWKLLLSSHPITDTFPRSAPHGARLLCTSSLEQDITFQFAQEAGLLIETPAIKTWTLTSE